MPDSAGKSEEADFDLTVLSRKHAKVPHPNSLAAKALHDPELKEKIEDGRKRAEDDLRSMEQWYYNGCIST